MEKECWMCENFEESPFFSDYGKCAAAAETVLQDHGVKVSVTVAARAACDRCPYFDMTAEAEAELSSEEWGNVDTTGVVPRGGYQAARQRGVRPGVDFPASM